MRCERCLTGKDAGLSHAGSQGRTVPAAELTQWVFYGLTSAGLWARWSGILHWQGMEIQLRLKEKSSLLAHVVPGRAGEGAARLQNSGGWAHVSPALSLLTCSLISSLWGLVSFSPTTCGLLQGTGSLAAGSCGYRNPASWPKGRGNCPTAPLRTTQGNAYWHSGDHILACLKHPNKHPVPLLSIMLTPENHACWALTKCLPKCQVLGNISLNPHNCPAERYTGQDSLGSY